MEHDEGKQQKSSVVIFPLPADTRTRCLFNTKQDTVHSAAILCLNDATLHYKESRCFRVANYAAPNRGGFSSVSPLSETTLQL
jgi:hypothetical protein